MEFRKLNANEIDVRIARVTQYNVMLLLYKDARCDQNILDETVGAMNWQRHHSRDNANCIVSIWDSEKKMWIEKEDTGTESFTEAEKGLASDSFKRACFNWGIGRELYTAPNITFSAKAVNIKDGKCYDKFSVTDIQYEGNRISFLQVIDVNTGSAFEWSKSQDDEQKAVENQVISETKYKALCETLKNEGIMADTVCKLYKVKSLKAITEKMHLNIINNLEKIKEAQGGV